MVACTACSKSGQACRMSSSSARCGNCYQSGIATCVPVHIPVPDFSSINWEIEKLSEEEEAAELQLDAEEQAATDALVRTQAARAKLQRLQKQKRLLKQKEQEIFDKGRDNAEALEQLEQLELFNQEMVLANPDAPADAPVDWSAFWTGGDALDGTLPEVGGSL
ncbi:hypothetical protein EJ02DRAFT_455990 [Clathrospora elynae]|uniref:Uncharacterized protein n=1 Tax=Clathrospora elynae TaxID=706981 RepID=A0A6A5SIK3_9PLEO|nr:hypothetical protein EJ02DRAFT_455990 [Clathrospora elynae]